MAFPIGPYVDSFSPVRVDSNGLITLVFSQKYGVGTTRYPVTYMARYNYLMGTLFSDAATSTISLHRS